MELRVGVLKEKLEALPDDTVVCVGEEGDYISVDDIKFVLDVYTNSMGDEKEGELLIMKNE